MLRNMQYGPGLNSVLQHELFIMEDRPTIRAIALEGGKSVCRLGGGGGTTVTARNDTAN